MKKLLKFGFINITFTIISSLTLCQQIIFLKNWFSWQEKKALVIKNYNIKPFFISSISIFRVLISIEERRWKTTPINTNEKHTRGKKLWKKDFY